VSVGHVSARPGARGAIGGPIVVALIARGHEVVGLTRDAVHGVV
jgi:hypothetical protein